MFIKIRMRGEFIDRAKQSAAITDLDMSGEEAGEASTLARLASSLWMAEASEVGLAVEP